MDDLGVPLFLETSIYFVAEVPSLSWLVSSKSGRPTTPKNLAKTSFAMEKKLGLGILGAARRLGYCNGMVICSDY